MKVWTPINLNGSDAPAWNQKIVEKEWKNIANDGMFGSQTSEVLFGNLRGFSFREREKWWVSTSFLPTLHY